jgi:hypothetical protein
MKTYNRDEDLSLDIEIKRLQSEVVNVGLFFLNR